MKHATKAEFAEVMQSVPVPFALCDGEAVIGFRTAGWLQRFQAHSEQVVMPTDAAAPRLLAIDAQGAPVEVPLRAHRVDSGFWLELEAEDAAAATKVTELTQRVADLEQHAFKDSLTGLWNRRFYDATLPSEVARSERYGQPISLLVIDVDRFKSINDTWGHAVGDLALQSVARILSQRCRSSDVVMRWGGDEFAVLATFCSWRNAAALAQDLCKRVEAAELAPGVGTTLSIGVAQYIPGQSTKTWFDRVDAQLYLAKQGGRNSAFVDRVSPPDMDQAVVQLLWRDSYICGHPTIDDQHQILVGLANRVLQAALPGANKSVDPGRLLLDLDELLGHVVRHFADEEAVLAAVGYPRARQHGLLHGHLVQQALAIRAQVSDGSADLGKLIDFLARDVVVKHMATADADFFPWLQETNPDAAAGV
jgi:diguanylate cyclase (GGDEF)-like protein/hemerythrin-like metal-binding protein